MRLVGAAVVLGAAFAATGCEEEVDLLDDREEALGQVQQAAYTPPTCAAWPSSPPTENEDRGSIPSGARDTVYVDHGDCSGTHCYYIPCDRWTIEWDNARTAVVSIPDTVTNQQDCEELWIRAAFYTYGVFGWGRVATVEDYGVWNGTACLEPLVYYQTPNTNGIRMRVVAEGIWVDGSVPFGQWETRRTMFNAYHPAASFP